jgi:hypothetical protein
VVLGRARAQLGDSHRWSRVHRDYSQASLHTFMVHSSASSKPSPARVCPDIETQVPLKGWTAILSQVLTHPAGWAPLGPSCLLRASGGHDSYVLTGLDILDPKCSCVRLRKRPLPSSTSAVLPRSGNHPVAAHFRRQRCQWGRSPCVLTPGSLDPSAHSSMCVMPHQLPLPSQDEPGAKTRVHFFRKFLLGFPCKPKAHPTLAPFL